MAMEQAIIAINAGGSSAKYGLYVSGEERLFMHFERTERGFARTTGNAAAEAISKKEFEHSRAYFVDAVHAAGFRVAAVGVRTVAMGTYFTKNRMVNDEFLAELAAVAEFDPVHTTTALELLSELRLEYGPQGIPVVAVSDSAFHTSMNPAARIIALPEELVKRRDLHRFGYHGVALSAVSREGVLPRTIVCHLGSGSSVTALVDGKSADTSMGYSPLEGLIMSSRSGSVDPAAVLALSHEYEVDDALVLLYAHSGLHALSSLSDDMRILLAHEEVHDGARRAIDAYVYRIVQYIGAYVATLGGVDEIIFSGTIGERSAPIRRKVCSKLSVFGVDLDQSKNDAARMGDDISAEGSIPIIVRRADESREIARVAREVAQLS